MKTNQLTQKRLKELLHYDPETGVFTRRWPRGAAKAGSVAGTPHNAGYLQIVIDSKHYLLHRLAVLYMTGAHPLADTDHKDGNRANNKWANLRVADRSQNGCNKAMQKNNTSGIKGVSWCSAYSKWKAQLSFQGRRVLAKNFEKIEDAALAVRQAREKYHGNFTNHGE